MLSAFFPTRNTQKKRDILSKKRESGMTLKKREFRPESGTVDTYGMYLITKQSRHQKWEPAVDLCIFEKLCFQHFTE